MCASCVGLARWRMIKTCQFRSFTALRGLSLPERNTGEASLMVALGSKPFSRQAVCRALPPASGVPLCTITRGSMLWCFMSWQSWDEHQLLDLLVYAVLCTVITAMVYAWLL
jgi:hypothetical protein